MASKALLCGDHELVPLVAAYMVEMGRDVTIVSPNERLRVPGVPFVRGDPSKRETLLSAGVERAETILVVCKEDWDAAFIIMNCRKLNPDALIVANANKESSTAKLYAVGASRVVFPLSVSGHLIASSAVSPVIAEFMDRIILTQDLEIGHLVVDADSRIKGKTLSDLDVGRRTGCIVIGMIDRDKNFHPNPSPDSKIEEGQTLLCLGPSAGLRKFFESAKPAYKEQVEEGEGTG